MQMGENADSEQCHGREILMRSKPLPSATTA
jgi:hypothetical protein